MIAGGFANGYLTVRASKYFGCTDWKTAALFCATMLPTMFCFTFATVDVIEWFEKSEQ